MTDNKPVDWDEKRLGPRLGMRESDPVVDPSLADDGDAWRAQLKYTQQGNLLATVDNVLLILNNDPAWDGVLGQDERTLNIMILQPPPFGDTTEKGNRLITDSDAVYLMSWLDRAYDARISHKVACDCMAAVAARNHFDRVRDYLEAVEWDGIERLPQLLPVYFGATDNTYTRTIGCRWMISAVARTMQPGCKADHVLVIEGDQGTGKSSAVQLLCGDEWFGDNIPPVESKDAQQYIGGTWIIELAEMDAANRAEASTLKSFITTSTDKYRPPYGRFMVNQPRRCVFAGTVNHDTYLKDDTGGRRFWCFAASGINLAGLEEDRDQLWAEAVHRFRQGEIWWLDEPEIIALAKNEQADRLDEDPWQAKVTDWLAKPQNRYSGSNGVTSAHILESAIDLDASRQNQSHMNRMGRVMRALGWKSYRKRSADGTLRVWKNTNDPALPFIGGSE